MGKAVAWISLAFVVGGIVGAWGPSRELSDYRDRASEDRHASSPSRSGGKKRIGLDPIAQFVNVPDTARRPRKRPVKPETAEESGAASGVQDAAPTNSVAAAEAEAKPRAWDAKDLGARIDEAADLWRTRIQLRRATALESLGIAQDAAGDFDAALSDMNDKLRESVQEIADALADEEEMTPELAVRMMGDMATILAETYDQLGECVDEARRGDVSALQLAEFIDPSVAEPLVAVQDKLGSAPGGKRGK